MSTQDDEFLEKLRATFKVEADEHLQAISSGLLELERSPDSAPMVATIETIYREAHSLKGAARAADLAELESICHGLESAFSAWKKEGVRGSPDVFDTLHHTLDAIKELLVVADGKQPGGDEHHRKELIRCLGRLEFRPFHESQSQPPSQLQPDQLPSQSQSDQVPSQSQPAPSDPPHDPPPEAPAHDPPAEPMKAPAADTVRISVSRLDARLLQAEDMLSVKAMAAERAAELRQVTRAFALWRKEWGKVSAATRALQQSLEQQPGDHASFVAGAYSEAAFKSMVRFLDWNCDFVRSTESKLQSLAGQAEQDRHHVARRVDDLLEESKKLLMLPFSTISGLFPRVVRDLAREQDKEVDLVIQGEDVAIDKRILEEMKDPIIHMLRNCVDHGVEPRAERERSNKPARATLTLAVTPVDGNKVEILVSDDGSGIDIEEVKASAMRRNLISAPEARDMGETEALSLIFQSGVTTSPIVTTISGRGLGMAIVRAKAEQLGAQIAVQTRRHAGTTLRIVLPLTLSTFRGVLLKAAGRAFVAPMVHVERVLRLTATEIKTVENRQSFILGDRAVALVRLDELLQIPPGPRPADPSAPLSVIVLHFADQRIGFVVDEVLHEEEVLVKALRKPLVKVRNIAGATLLGSGRAVPILNVADLIKTARTYSGPAVRTGDAGAGKRRAGRKVLVVEDSITSRMLLKGILEAAGHEVTTAVDGVDAFTALRQKEFELVVSDVEMPRMNGFDLTARIRSDRRLAELPVVLVTALESREERERGVDAGANAYIIKSSFDQSNLLEVIGGLI